MSQYDAHLTGFPSGGGGGSYSNQGGGFGYQQGAVAAGFEQAQATQKRQFSTPHSQAAGQINLYSNADMGVKSPSQFHHQPFSPASTHSPAPQQQQIKSPPYSSNTSPMVQSPEGSHYLQTPLAGNVRGPMTQLLHSPNPSTTLANSHFKAPALDGGVNADVRSATESRSCMDAMRINLDAVSNSDGSKPAGDGRNVSECGPGPSLDIIRKGTDKRADTSGGINMTGTGLDIRTASDIGAGSQEASPLPESRRMDPSLSSLNALSSQVENIPNTVQQLLLTDPLAAHKKGGKRSPKKSEMLREQPGSVESSIKSSNCSSPAGSERMLFGEETDVQKSFHLENKDQLHQSHLSSSYMLHRQQPAPSISHGTELISPVSQPRLVNKDSGNSVGAPKEPISGNHLTKGDGKCPGVIVSRDGIDMSSKEYVIRKEQGGAVEKSDTNLVTEMNERWPFQCVSVISSGMEDPTKREADSLTVEINVNRENAVNMSSRPSTSDLVSHVNATSTMGKSCQMAIPVQEANNTSNAKASDARYHSQCTDTPNKDHQGGFPTKYGPPPSSDRCSDSAENSRIALESFSRLMEKSEHEQMSSMKQLIRDLSIPLQSVDSHVNKRNSASQQPDQLLGSKGECVSNHQSEIPSRKSPRSNTRSSVLQSANMDKNQSAVDFSQHSKSPQKHAPGSYFRGGKTSPVRSVAQAMPITAHSAPSAAMGKPNPVNAYDSKKPGRNVEAKKLKLEIPAPAASAEGIDYSMSVTPDRKRSGRRPSVKNSIDGQQRSPVHGHTTKPSPLVHSDQSVSLSPTKPSAGIDMTGNKNTPPTLRRSGRPQFSPTDKKGTIDDDGNEKRMDEQGKRTEEQQSTEAAGKRPLRRVSSGSAAENIKGPGTAGVSVSPATSPQLAKKLQGPPNSPVYPTRMSPRKTSPRGSMSAEDGPILPASPSNRVLSQIRQTPSDHQMVNSTTNSKGEMGESAKPSASADYRQGMNKRRQVSDATIAIDMSKGNFARKELALRNDQEENDSMKRKYKQPAKDLSLKRPRSESLDANVNKQASVVNESQVKASPNSHCKQSLSNLPTPGRTKILPPRKSRGLKLEEIVQKITSPKRLISSSANNTPDGHTNSSCLEAILSGNTDQHRVKVEPEDKSDNKLSLPAPQQKTNLNVSPGNVGVVSPEIVTITIGDSDEEMHGGTNKGIRKAASLQPFKYPNSDGSTKTGMPPVKSPPHAMNRANAFPALPTTSVPQNANAAQNIMKASTSSPKWSRVNLNNAYNTSSTLSPPGRSTLYRGPRFPAAPNMTTSSSYTARPRTPGIVGRPRAPPAVVQPTGSGSATRPMVSSPTFRHKTPSLAVRLAAPGSMVRPTLCSPNVRLPGNSVKTASNVPAVRPSATGPVIVRASATGSGAKLAEQQCRSYVKGLDKPVCAIKKEPASESTAKHDTSNTGKGDETRKRKMINKGKKLGPVAKKRRGRPKKQFGPRVQPNEPEIKLKSLSHRPEEKTDSKIKCFSPYIRLQNKNNLKSMCTVVNSNDEESKLDKPKKSSGTALTQTISHIVPLSSCFVMGRVVTDTQNKGALVCCFCGFSANFKELGDLFGPYYPQGHAPAARKPQSAPSKDRPSEDAEVASETTRVSEEPEEGGHKASPAEPAGSSDHRGTKKPRAGSTDENCASLRGSTRGARCRKPSCYCCVDSDGAVEKSSDGRSRKGRKEAAEKESPTAEAQPPPEVPLDNEEFWVHQPCAVWTSDVFLVGGRLYGLLEAVEIARDVSCSKCQRTGATLGCHGKGCAQRYHFICAMEADCLLCEDNFLIKCAKHKGRGMAASVESTERR